MRVPVEKCMRVQGVDYNTKRQDAYVPKGKRVKGERNAPKRRDRKPGKVRVMFAKGLCKKGKLLVDDGQGPEGLTFAEMRRRMLAYRRMQWHGPYRVYRHWLAVYDELPANYDDVPKWKREGREPTRMGGY